MNKKLSVWKPQRTELMTERLPASPERVIAPQQLTLSDLFGTLRRRKWTILGFAAMVLALTFAYAYTRTPLYEGIARLQIDPSRSTSLGLSDADKSEPGEVDSRVKTEIEIIQSNTVAAQVIDALRLYANPRFANLTPALPQVDSFSQLQPSERQSLLEAFRNDLTVRVMPNTAVVEIRFKNSDPALASEVANSVIDEYRKRNFVTRTDGTAQVSLWLNKQLEEIRESTSDAQGKLAQFQRANNLLGTNESENIVTDRLKQLNGELTQAEADRIIKEGRYRLAKSGNPELIDATLSSPTLQVLRSQQAELSSQYAQLSTKFGNGYPKVKELSAQLAQVDAHIRVEVANVGQRLENEYDTAVRAERMIRSDFNLQKQQAYKLNENVSQYATLRHEVESGRQLYDTLQLKLKEAGIASGLTSSYVNVIDRAQVPVRPVEPRKKLYLALGLGGGLFGGLLLGLLRDSMDHTVQTAEQLEAISGIPELGSVPFLSALAGAHRKPPKPALSFLLDQNTLPAVVFRKPVGHGVEAYRSLCSVIQMALSESSAKVLVVASAASGEGKSTVSLNLAATLALRGKKVILVDADLRCSTFNSVSNPESGLSTICATGAAHHPQFQPLANLPNLHIVPAGSRPSDPTGVLDSAGMQDLLSSWRAEYDHVIIDTPPVLPFADALSLAARADGVILVARAGVTHSQALLRARDLLVRSGGNLLGFVLNGVKERESYYDFPPAYQRVIESQQQKN